MGSFQYEAMRLQDKSRVKGVISAGTEKEARLLLREQELMTLKLQPIVEGKSGKKFNPLGFLKLGNGVAAKDKIAFTRNLGMMVKAGVPVTEALMYFESYSDNPVLKKLGSTVRKDILGGMSLSGALERQKNLFNGVFIGIIQAGESSGELESTLQRLTDLMVRSEKLKSKITSASVYPCIVIAILGLVLLVMFLFVLPTFEKIYKQMNVELPLITQIMMAISYALRAYWYLSFPAMLASGFGLLKFFTTPAGKRFLDVWLLKVPVIQDLINYANTSYWVSTLMVSFSAGVPITDSLELAATTVSNSVIHAKLKEISPKVQVGHKLASALEPIKNIPQLVMLMIATGEESGELERMLGASFEYLEEEVHVIVDRLTQLVEPVLLVVLGVIVTVVALGVYLPLFSIYENL
jgi:type IV pilus assembly protein PilC